MEKPISLRALEPEDLEFLFDLENDSNLWYLSNQHQPMSKFLLKNYIENADRDIFEVGQFRFAIEKRPEKKLIGFVDLFDFDPKNKRVGVGIIIKQKKYRNKGLGKLVLQEIIDYCFNTLYLHQIFANILSDNFVSIQLFESLGFKQNGIKKDWIFDGIQYRDEFFYQLIKE